MSTGSAKKNGHECYATGIKSFYRTFNYYYMLFITITCFLLLLLLVSRCNQNKKMGMNAVLLA